MGAAESLFAVEWMSIDGKLTNLGPLPQSNRPWVEPKSSLFYIPTETMSQTI